MPARRAARIFSRTPPTGRTRPVRVTSPVIARFWWIGLPRNRLIRAAAIATPAEGPSLGTAPAGTWMCTSVLPNRDGSMSSGRGVAPQVAHGGLGALAHRLAEQAGQGQAPLAGHAGRLDEEDLAAGRGPGQAGGDAGRCRSGRRPRGRSGAGRATRPPAPGSIVVALRSPSACLRATLRQIAAISRSRFRRPASRV